MNIQMKFRPYTTVNKWDNVYSFFHWGVTPEGIPFFPGFKDTLRALEEVVQFPNDLYQRTITERKALFFNKVLADYLPVMILEGELMISNHFNTSLSKVLTESETKLWDKGQTKFFMN